MNQILKKEIKLNLEKIGNSLKRPDQNIIDDILCKIGVSPSDELYPDLNSFLTKMIRRKSRQEDFYTFFTEYSAFLNEKVKNVLSKKDEEILKQKRLNAELKSGLARSKNQIISETLKKLFAPDFVTISDYSLIQLLQSLRTGKKDYNNLKSELNLRKNDFSWRVKFLEEMGFIYTDYSSKKKLIRLLPLGLSIISKRGENMSNQLIFPPHPLYIKLAKEAIGKKDEAMVTRLLKWVNGSYLKNHEHIIRNLMKKYDDPKLVSQGFFHMREQGSAHEKHIGVKIVNHEAAGRLLFLCLDKNKELESQIHLPQPINQNEGVKTTFN